MASVPDPPQATVFGTPIPGESEYERDAPRVDINVDEGEVRHNKNLFIKLMPDARSTRA